jgi:ATP-dependent Clp protease ATP-binding subunit ClpC
MNREIYPKVKIIMTNSIKEAKNFDDVKVRPEHIILSMLLDDDNECVKTLKKLKIDTTELYDKLSDYVRKNDLTPRAYTSVKRTLPFSEETKSIIAKGVDKECEGLNDTMIDTTHIMLAILITKQPVVDFLNSVGVNYNLFKITMIGNKPEDIKNGALGDDMNEENDSFKKKQKPIDPKSKTPVLDNFCRDVSKAVEKGEIDPVVGRTTEIKRVSQILSRRKKNNPILIGEPGVGKCFIGDTQVVMRNDLTGEVFKATINEFLKTFTDTETTN